MCVEIRDYNFFLDELPGLVKTHNWNSVLLGKKLAYSGGASYAVYSAIPEDKVKFENSPVMLMKAQKNDVGTCMYLMYK